MVSGLTKTGAPLTCKTTLSSRPAWTREAAFGFSSFFSSFLSPSFLASVAP